MSVLKYKDMVFDSFEELLEVMKKDGIVKEEDDWQAQLKVYDPPEFLRMALKYSREMPPDLTQASEKMWLSVVHTVKLFFLEKNIYLASHRSLSFFFYLAVEKLSDGKLIVRLDRAWRTAERLHSYAYGTPAFRIVHFQEIYEEIKFFVEQFPKINSPEVQSEIDNLIKKGSLEKKKDIDYCLFTDKIKPKLGKKQFSPQYKFF